MSTTTRRIAPPPPPSINTASGPTTPQLGSQPSSPSFSSQPLVSPSRKSRFQFHSDTKAPVELKKIEQQSHKRHTEFRRRVIDLDRNVAEWTASFSKEIVQRDKDSAELYDYAVSHPLEGCAERFMRRMHVGFSNLQGSGSGSGSKTHRKPSSDEEFHDDDFDGKENAERESTCLEDDDLSSVSDSIANNDNGPSLQSLTHQVSALANNLMQHVHVTTPQLRDQHLDAFQRKVKSEIPPKLHMEKTKAAKREQAIFQKFESMAGLASRSLAEENAARIASLQMLKDKILEAGGWDEKRTTRFLDEVNELKREIQEEREARMESDETVLAQIVECRKILHKTLLDSMTDE